MDPILGRWRHQRIGHWWGYRNFVTEDASTNITPVAAWIGGEELHNNHHAYPTSAKFSIRWYEFDLGWFYIRTLSIMGLATVRKTAPKVKLDPSKFEVDAATLQAVIAHRYDVLAHYAQTMKQSFASELAALGAKGHDSGALKTLRQWLNSDARDLPKCEKVGPRARIEPVAQHDRLDAPGTLTRLGALHALHGTARDPTEGVVRACRAQ